MRSVLWLIPIVVLVAVVSCEGDPDSAATPRSDSPGEPPAIGREFDASTCATITGRVAWSGEKPNPSPFLFGAPAADGNFTVNLIPNPNAPRIHELTRGVTDAVVSLRGIDPARSRPWDHVPVRVRMKDRGVVVLQGESTARVGFVRRGDSVEMASAEPVFHVLRARDAAFFSLTFPQPDQPLARIFDTAGRVELSSGAGFYWANASLFVSDHPYFTRTDSEGQFELKQVPPGEYEIVSWLPNWTVAKQERDPETGLIFRQTYGPPLESRRRIVVAKGGAAKVDFEMRP